MDRDDDFSGRGTVLSQGMVASVYTDYSEPTAFQRSNDLLAVKSGELSDHFKPRC
jgi:hypothetical protein